MPRKSGRRSSRWSRFSLTPENGANNSESRLKIGSENAERWSNLRCKFGFINDVEFADYLLTLAENKRPEEGLCQPTLPIQEATVPPTEVNNRTESVITEGEASKNLESSEFMSLMMECEDHN